jgi:predicted anti-sigma-YlaC factor YlaD
MLNCRQTSVLISKSLDQALPLSDRIGVRLHLLICSGCRNFSKQSRFLRHAGRGYLDYLENRSRKDSN